MSTKAKLPKRQGRNSAPLAPELDLARPQDVIEGEIEFTIPLAPERYENLDRAEDRMAPILADVPWGEFTERQRAFIEFYCADPTNGTRAALNAGYAPSCAAAESVYALKNPRVSAIIARVMNARLERTQLTVDKILHELEVLMTANISDFETDGTTVRVRPGRPEYLIKAVRNVEYVVERLKDGTVIERVRVFLYNKETILRMAGQYHKMFSENINHNVSGSVGVTHTWQVGDKQISF